MKLSTYAKKNNLTYRTAHNHFKAGKIKGKQLESGTIVVSDKDEELYVELLLLIEDHANIEDNQLLRFFHSIY